MLRKQVLTDVLLWLGWDLFLLDVLRRLGDARIRRGHFKSTGSQRAHRPPVVQRVTASSRMNQLAYFIVMISLRPYHDFPLVFQTLAAVESTRPPV